MGSAEEALNSSKARKLSVAAEWYLAEHPGLDDPIWRIDLVAITLDGGGNVIRLTHITNAAVIE
jgi:Holliday junction resolvase-like predicted endonuclease